LALIQLPELDRFRKVSYRPSADRMVWQA
jgi:hypothetical protein